MMTRVLPPDILSMLFAHLRRDDPEVFNDYRDLISASHVCKHWRQVAVDDSSLWDHISISLVHYSHLPTFIARAKSRPLSIRVLFDDSVSHLGIIQEFSASLGIISGHWNRIRALSLKLLMLSDSNTFTLASSWIGSLSSTQGLPSSLENLHIHRDLRCAHFSFLVALLSHPLPESLKVVHLNRSPIPVHFSALRRLTHLSLYRTEYPSPTINQVVEILRSLPDLEVLQLHTFISHNETSSIQPVSLPHLRHLGLISSIDIPNDGMKVLFDKLDICPDACVHLILPINLVPNLPPHFTSDLRTSEISVSMPHGFVKMDIQAVRSNSSLKYSTAHIQASHAQIFGPPPGKKMVLTILLSVLRRSTWSRPSSCLRVDFSQCSGGQPTAEDWSSVFECLPTLESMEVQLACSHGGFRSLTEPPWNPQTSGEMGEIEAASLLISVLSEQAVCPKLRRLVFPAIDRSQLTEKFSGTVKAFMEGRESRGLPYLDIILGELPASDA